MRAVTPTVRLIAKPEIDWNSLLGYLSEIPSEGGEKSPIAWGARRVSSPHPNDAQTLMEAAGRGCYRSWVPGANPNVTRVREDPAAYFKNLLNSGHGSVLEHANFSFIISDVSRVVTHELVRHRAGTAISQESMRFVRLDDIPFWMPDWVDEETRERVESLVAQMEDFQRWAADHYGLDEEGVPFAIKKKVTSFMRRVAPEGVGTMLTWTANVRALRHIIEARTSVHAEEEIRLVFDQVAAIMKQEVPLLFSDFIRDSAGQWVPTSSKI